MYLAGMSLRTGRKWRINFPSGSYFFPNVTLRGRAKGAVNFFPDVTLRGRHVNGGLTTCSDPHACEGEGDSESGEPGLRDTR